MTSIPPITGLVESEGKPYFVGETPGDDAINRAIQALEQVEVAELPGILTQVAIEYIETELLATE